MPPADEETEAGFRVLVKQTLKSINEKLIDSAQDALKQRETDDITRADHEKRIRDLERRALIAFGFALCLSSLSMIATIIQFFTN